MEILARVQSLLAPPEFPDEDTQRIASTVHWLGLAFLTIDLFAAAVMVFMLPSPLPRVVVSVLFVAIVCSSQMLIRRGRVRGGAWVLVVGIWWMLVIGLVVSRDVTNPAVSGFVLAIATAGLVLGSRAAFAVSFLSMVAGPAVDLLGLHLAAPPGPRGTLDPGVWLVQASIYLGAAVLVTIAVRHAEASRDRARQSEARFRALAENASDMITEFDAQGRFIYANPAAMIGAKLADIKEIVRERVGAWVHPEDAPSVVEEFTRLTKEGGSARASYRMVDAGRGKRWLESIAVRFFDAAGQTRVVSITRDVTRQRETEAALRESEGRYRLLAEHAPDMIVEHDHTGRIIYANRRTLEFLGYTMEELGALELGSWMHPEDAEACMAGFREVMEFGRSMRLVHRLRRKDGNFAWVASSGAPLVTASGETHMVAQSRDLTEELSLQEQLRQSQKMDAIGRLAGGVAHDFNNLLTVIGGYASVLEASLPAGAESAAAHEITEATDRAAALTRQLLLLSRRQIVQPGAIDLNAAIRGLEPMLRRTLPESIALELALEPDLPAIDVDPSQVDQILLNLTLNARDAIGSHGRLRIETSLAPSRRFVQVRVTDTGQGMSEEVRARAFEPFFTTKPPGLGTGLGLSTTYGIVRQAGGTVSLESTLGAGTSVEISLPAAAAPGASPARRRTGQRDHAARPATILLVEDDAAVRRLLAILLESSGHRVTAAADPAEALGIVESSNRRFDLVLTDYVMPGQSGVQLANTLRARWSDLRIVLMTGHAEIPGGESTELPRGAALLEKPFTREQLQRAIASLLETV